MASAPVSDPGDPLTGKYSAERVNYATGVMLQADDFEAEQTYHRGRMAMLMRHMLGFGTLSGLKVTSLKGENNQLELRVEPGIAVDRYGRMIEVPSPQCIQVGRWFANQSQKRLSISTHNKSRTSFDKAVVADVFLSAHPCGRGKTPSFASGPFDALDALVAARVAENPRLEMVLRSEGNPDPEAGTDHPADLVKPQNFWPKAGADAKAQLDAVMGSWDHGAADTANENLRPLVEHVRGRDYSAILLARIAIAVTAENDARGYTITKMEPAKGLTIDNSIRPFIYFPGKWFGRALT
ncbi:MAG: hypothetical protein RL481_1002 [Pseudomonadota bacterium]